MHKIVIEKANLGFIVVVGCQTFVFENEKKMFTAISEYHNNPEDAKKKYVEKDRDLIGYRMSMKGENQDDEDELAVAIGPASDVMMGTPRIGKTFD